MDRAHLLRYGRDSRVEGAHQRHVEMAARLDILLDDVTVAVVMREELVLEYQNFLLELHKGTV